MKPERDIVREILRVLGSRPELRLWKHPTGVARALSNEAVITYGLPGSADLIGLLAATCDHQGGRFLAIEVKSLTGRQSIQQKRFQAMIERFNGVYILARSAEDALAQLRQRGYCL